MHTYIHRYIHAYIHTYIPTNIYMYTYIFTMMYCKSGYFRCQQNFLVVLKHEIKYAKFILHWDIPWTLLRIPPNHKIISQKIWHKNFVTQKFPDFWYLLIVYPCLFIHCILDTFTYSSAMDDHHYCRKFGVSIFLNLCMERSVMLQAINAIGLFNSW